jgi:F0F1-type ATP synthase assembly protein I
MDEQQSPEKPPETNVWRQIGRYSHMGMILPASVVVGLAIGTVLDKHFHTKWMTLTGLLVGAVAGFAELIRLILRASKEQ